MTVTAAHPPHVEQHLQRLEDVPREMLVSLAVDSALAHDRHAVADYYDLAHAIPRARAAADILLCPSCGGAVSPTGECRCSA